MADNKNYYGKTISEGKTRGNGMKQPPQTPRPNITPRPRSCPQSQYDPRKHETFQRNSLGKYFSPPVTKTNIDGLKVSDNGEVISSVVHNEENREEKPTEIVREILTPDEMKIIREYRKKRDNYTPPQIKVREESKEQRLIDIVFEIALVIKNNEILQGMKIEEFAEWVTSQLENCGFPTKPCGSSWGVLIKKNNKLEVK